MSTPCENCGSHIRVCADCDLNKGKYIEIPDNATNGEIMQMMFPDGVTAKFATFMRFVVGEDEYINCAYDWWDAPYQKGGKE